MNNGNKRVDQNVATRMVIDNLATAFRPSYLSALSRNLFYEATKKSAILEALSSFKSPRLVCLFLNTSDDVLSH